MTPLQIECFDLKTGRTLYDRTDGAEKPRIVSVEHSCLGHWLETHQIKAQFYKAKFNDVLEDVDRNRVEKIERRFLAFINGEDAYFTDEETLRLMTEGDPARKIQPLYGDGNGSTHPYVAYGNLLLSGNRSSMVVESARILVVDDQSDTLEGAFGEQPILDLEGNPVAKADLQTIWGQLGDGAMLAAPHAMETLVIEDRDQIVERTFKEAGVSAEFSTLAEDLSQLDTVSEQAIDRKFKQLASRKVLQFRAMTPDASGTLKGTVASSKLCGGCDFNFIIPKSCIKGDDGQLSRIGVQQVSRFFVNRSTMEGKDGRQEFGMQAFACLPGATKTEINPRRKAKAEELSSLAGDHKALAAYYTSQKERYWQQIESRTGESPRIQAPDKLYDILEADDTFGQYLTSKQVTKGLNKFLQGEWRKLALTGGQPVSALAQPHRSLKPWEISYKGLDDGDLVVIWRSPVPNVSVMTCAIVNNRELKERDLEAFSRSGVIHLNPSTASNYVIDFDGDRVTMLECYKAVAPNFVQQVQQKLASVEHLSAKQQHDAAQELFKAYVQEMEVERSQVDSADWKSPIAPTEFPECFKEVIERNNPGPPKINKQEKIPYDPKPGETHSATLFRAWKFTANSPVSKAAYLGQSLLILAGEAAYCPDDQKKQVLRQASAAYLKLLKRVEKKEIEIPKKEALKQYGLPEDYNFRSRIFKLAGAQKHIEGIKNSERQSAAIDKHLSNLSKLHFDVANGIVATFVQTGADTPKSQRQIDTALETFAEAIAYKTPSILKEYKNPGNYVGNQIIDADTFGPVGEGIWNANNAYLDAQAQAVLTDSQNQEFQSLFPKECTHEQEKQAFVMALTNNQINEARRKAEERLQEDRPEDRLPTLAITTHRNNLITIQNLWSDPEGILPLSFWRASNENVPDWKLTAHLDDNAPSSKTRFPVDITFTDKNGERLTKRIGYVSPEDAITYHFAKQIRDRVKAEKGNLLPIPVAQAKIRPPFCLENDVDALRAKSIAHADACLAQIQPEEHRAYLSAMWRDYRMRTLGTRLFHEELVERLKTPPPSIRLTGLKQSVNQTGALPSGTYIVRFGEFSYDKLTTDGTRQTRTTASVSLVKSEGEQRFASIDPRSVHLPLGTTVVADIEIESSGKVANMQVLSPVSSAEADRFLELIDADSNTSKPVKERLIRDEYNPSRGELREWYRAALDNHDHERADWIEKQGERLRDLFREESSPDAIPNLDYWHPEVVISSEDRQEMGRAISARVFSQQEKETELSY